MLRRWRSSAAASLPERSETFAAMGYSAPLSIPHVIDQLVPRLAAALDGDPATKVAP